MIVSKEKKPILHAQKKKKKNSNSNNNNNSNIIILMTIRHQNKTKLVKVRMTEKEFDQLKYFSEITNQNMSEFVRSLIENRPPKIIKDLPISQFKILNSNLAKLGNYQVKLNRDFLNYIAQYPDNLISLEELLKVKENLENSRMNLLREISETKVILSEILKELR